MKKVIRVRGAQPAVDFYEAIVSPEVAASFRRWTDAVGMDSGVLVGDIALAFYTRPRFVHEIVFVYADAARVPTKVAGFVRQSPSAMTDAKTGTMVQLISPNDETMPEWLAAKLRDTSIVVEGTQIASLHGMLASKLAAAARGGGQALQHQQDVINILTWHAHAQRSEMRSWRLGAAQADLLSELMSIAIA